MFTWILLLPAVGISVYFYFFFRRAFSAFGVDKDAPIGKWSALLAGAALGLPCCSFRTIYALFVLHLFGFCVFFDLVRFLVFLGLKKKATLFQRARKLFACGVLPLVCTIALIIGGALNMANVRPTYYTVTTEKSIPDEGYRVAFVSDVHLGTSLDLTDIASLCHEIEDEKIDMLILGGDIVDEGSDRTELSALFSLFAGVESKYGTYFVFGNHDRSRRTNEDFEGLIEESGVTVLRDEALLLDDTLLLVGREDRGFVGEGQRLSVSDLLSPYDEQVFRLVLDHQPSDYAESADMGVDLLLSGHTHGGQLFPLNLLQEIIPFNDAVYGETPIGENGVAIVSSGVAGWAYPVKTAAPAEYLIIDINSKK